VRVAYYSPLPPERTGIADYSALILPELRRHLDVEVVRRGRRRAPRNTDVSLYHIGNNPDAHGWIVGALRRRRGIVVLHDFVLHHLIAGLTVGRGDGAGYLDAMQRDSGVAGRLIAHGVIDGVIPPVWETRAEEFPLVREVLDHADGVIVHSHYVEEHVRKSGFRGPVWRIPMPAPPESSAPRPFSLPRPASLVIGCFGNLNPAKRGPQLLKAFVEIRKRHPEALLVLAGGISSRYDLELQAEEHGLSLGESVVHLGYLDERDIRPLLASCDILVSLRWPTMGETSASVIRALAAGRPIVVSDVGWFSELPDGVAAKVPVGQGEVEILSAFLDALALDEELRRKMGCAAAEYARLEHDLDRVAGLYVAALEEAAGGSAVRDELAGELARSAWEVGLSARNPELSHIAAKARELGARPD
jgi:glycosyltransferase involved in cell wall biosynthesis